MIRALLLIFEPIPTWDRILRARRGILFILVLYVLPMLIITSCAETYRLIHWERPGEIKGLAPFKISQAVIYETLQFLLSLGVFFVGAKLIKAIGETFHGRHTFNQAFTIVAYGLSPLILFRLLDALPGMSPWVSWAVGITLSVAVLYQGVPRIMEPDPPHAFGLYLMGSLLLFLITGLARFVTAWYLQGRFPKIETLISQLAERLPLR